MKRKIFIYTLIGIFCFTGKYTFAQISEGGTPISFSSDMVTGKGKIPLIAMPSIDARTLLQEDEMARAENAQIPFRFGKDIDVDIDIKKDGIKKETRDGGNLWLLQIHCPEAFSINLIYDRFKLAEGSKFFIFNEDRTMILGAYTPEVSNNQYNEFATDLIQGNTIILEYYEPKFSENGVIHISKVIHGYVNTFDDSRGLGDSENCHNDVICQQWNNWINERRAVTLILVDNNTTFCSGCLVNNTSQDFTPYILTANHCYFNSDGSAKRNPSTNIFRFFYWRPNCVAGSNIGAGTPIGWQSITGATLRAHHSATDFVLLQLNTRPPTYWNVYYAGWDRTATPAQSSTCIHHPRGDAMKITVDNHAATIENNYDPPGGNGPANCWRVFWDSGSTQTGSSGSPLFNVSHRIVGQLYGGTASCSNPSGHDNFGRFHLSWTGDNTDATRLDNWLAPGLGNNAPQMLDGIVQTCTTTLSNTSITSNTTIYACLSVTNTFQNVTVLNGAKLTVISNGSEVILSNFEVVAGSQLEIQ